MGSVFFEFALFCLTAVLMFTAFLIIQTRKRPDQNSDDDGEGGLPVTLPPDFDLPPGVCLPDDPKRHKIMDSEEIFA